jgi:hypothetical protein
MELGLSYVWSSVRPIIKDKSIVVLVESTGLVNNEIISIKRINVFKQLFGLLSRVEIGATGGAVEPCTWLAHCALSRYVTGSRREGF